MLLGSLVAVGKVFYGCRAPCLWKSPSETFAKFRHFPQVEFWFASHISLCDAGPSLENFSSYLCMMRAEDSFPRSFTRPKKATEMSFVVPKLCSCLCCLLALRWQCSSATSCVLIRTLSQILVTPECQPPAQTPAT